MKRHNDLDGDDPTDGSDSPDSGRGLSERLRRILRSEGDDDLLVDVEGGVLRWLRALDLHVTGACRADERLKPLLKFNLSSGAAEDHLMAQLNQHFDVAEVGMLVRCLCVPLVSMRVGKVNKIGNMLFPTNVRGNLNLILSPLSDMRILFCGEDGCNERLGIVNHNSERSVVSVEEIPADCTGRSFLLRLPGDEVEYFWSAEKSKSVGAERIEKMKHLFLQRPSLSHLTGICESRLDSFASYLMMNVFSTANSIESKLGSSSNASIFSCASSHSLGMSHQSVSSTLKPLRARPGQAGKAHPVYQGSLSPRSNAFKDGTSKIIALRTGVKEKLKRLADINSGTLVSETTTFTASTLSERCSSSYQNLQDHRTEDTFNLPKLLPTLPISSFSALPSSSIAPLSFHHPLLDLSVSSPSHFSPYYCWCPSPSSPPLKHVVSPPTPSLPSFAPESITIPPLSSFFPTAGSSLFLPTQPPCEPDDLSALDLPSLLPSSSYLAMPTSQQILNFTPYIAEPIVHIPVIEVCSSGPGYLVSAGPAISPTIPLLPKLVNPLAPETESIAEKNARETLRMLMASAPSNPQLIKVLPTVLTSVDDNISYIHGKKHGLSMTGNRGLYARPQDVDSLASSMNYMTLTLSTSQTGMRGDKIQENADENPKHKDYRSKQDMEEVENSNSGE